MDSKLVAARSQCPSSFASFSRRSFARSLDELPIFLLLLWISYSLPLALSPVLSPSLPLAIPPFLLLLLPRRLYWLTTTRSPARSHPPMSHPWGPPVLVRSRRPQSCHLLLDFFVPCLISAISALFAPSYNEKQPTYHSFLTLGPPVPPLGCDKASRTLPW